MPLLVINEEDIIGSGREVDRAIKPHQMFALRAALLGGGFFSCWAMNVPALLSTCQMVQCQVSGSHLCIRCRLSPPCTISVVAQWRSPPAAQILLEYTSEWPRVCPVSQHVADSGPADQTASEAGGQITLES